MKNIVRSLPLALALVAAVLSPAVQAAGGHGGGGGGSGGGHGGFGGGFGGGHGGYGGGYYGGHGGYGGGYYGGHASGWYGGYGHGWGGYGLGIVYIGGYGYYGGGYGVYAPSYYYYGVEPSTAVPAPQAGQPVPQTTRAPDPIFYPRNGQSAATAESDLIGCNRWATTQRGAIDDASIFMRATVACMEGRGYTVR